MLFYYSFFSSNERRPKVKKENEKKQKEKEKVMVQERWANDVSYWGTAINPCAIQRSFLSSFIFFTNPSLTPNGIFLTSLSLSPSSFMLFSSTKLAQLLHLLQFVFSSLIPIVFKPLSHQVSLACFFFPQFTKYKGYLFLLNSSPSKAFLLLNLQYCFHTYNHCFPISLHRSLEVLNQQSMAKTTWSLSKLLYIINVAFQ